MLRRLSGRVHEVLTGVAVVTSESRRVAVESTLVTLARLDPRTIDWYVATGEPLDKAGAYGVQGIASRADCGLDTNVERRGCASRARAGRVVVLGLTRFRGQTLLV